MYNTYLYIFIVSSQYNTYIMSNLLVESISHIFVSNIHFQQFYLMEAGDTMFDFYTEIFDKVRFIQAKIKSVT